MENIIVNTVFKPWSFFSSGNVRKLRTVIPWRTALTSSRSCIAKHLTIWTAICFDEMTIGAVLWSCNVTNSTNNASKMSLLPVIFILRLLMFISGSFWWNWWESFSVEFRLHTYVLFKKFTMTSMHSYHRVFPFSRKIKFYQTCHHCIFR